MDRNANWLLILAALALLGGGGVAVYAMTRGIRNNNPGNIRSDGTVWQGLASPPSDGAYAVFIDPRYGIRALGRVLTNYIETDGVPPTVNAIIARWAPPSENDTLAYQTDVASDLNVDPDAELDFPSVKQALVTAIIRHENGLNPYSADTIAQGLALA